MSTGEALASIFARLFQAFEGRFVAVVVARVLAQTFEILRTEDRNVLEHFAITLGRTVVSTINLFGFNVVEEMVFVSMPAKTLTGRTYRFAINTIRIPPFDVQTILPGSFDIFLKFFIFLI